MGQGEDVEQERALAALDGLEISQLKPASPPGHRAVMEAKPGIDRPGDEAAVPASEKSSAPEETAYAGIGRVGSGLGDLAYQLQ
tara:strand:+ start:244 stop:495 length:252 start_codon:yes stop_codon:yes gene_type:complete